MYQNLNFQITKIWARNFRSIADASADLGELTVLVGGNMSGKSNVMDVLHFLKDALRSDLELAVTDRQGVGAVRRWQLKGRRHEIEIGLIAQGFVNRFGYSGDYRVRYEFTIASNKEGAYRVRSEHAKVLYPPISKPSVADKTAWFTNTNGILRSNGLQVLKRQGSSTDSPDTNLILPTFRQFFRPRRKPRHSPDCVVPQLALTELYRSLQDMQFYQLYPNGMRLPQRISRSSRLDGFGENLAFVLRDLLRKGSSSATKLREVLPHLIPGVLDVRVRPVGGYLVVQLQHAANLHPQENGPWFDLSQESDGALRLLGLLVALYQRPSPCFIGIEEPDLAVHPGLFGVMADVLREGSLNSQLLVTTHNPDLIDQLALEDLRVVELIGGNTSVGPVTDSQAQAAKERLFSPGELHRMEGLRLDGQDT